MGATVSVLIVAFALHAAPDDAFVLTDPNFLIPLNFDESKRANIREVLLYASTDQGRTWIKAAEAKPDAKEFTYTARTEGLYYFAVQSVDKSGVADPVDVSKSPKFLKIQYDSRRSATPAPAGPGPTGSPTTPDTTAAPPPPSFAPVSPVVQPPAPVTQANSVAPSPPAPIAPVAPPPIVPPPAVEQPQPQPPAATVPAPPAIPQSPPSNDGPSALTPLAPQKPAAELPPKPLTPPGSSAAPETKTATAALVQHVRDRQVALDFEVERKGPSGIKKIETWITQDDGGSWQKWNDTHETLSPVQVALPEAEGTYGFRIVLYSGVMQSAGPPRRGDEPDVKLHVDRTPPVVAYYAPVPDPNQATAITLRYSVMDLNLDAASVVLQWSRQPNVGWQTIAATNVRPMPSSGIAGMSEASWHLTPDVPDTVYLRITAKDKAGNVGEFVTREPVTLDLNKPTARIKAVLPVSLRR